jgi:membrane protease YdiL (CAAX protease family)
MVVIGSAGILAPGRWRPLRAFGWMLALCVLLVVAFNLVAKAALWLLRLLSGTDSVERLLAAVAGSVAVLLMYGFAVAWCERRDVPELELGRAPKDLLFGMAIGAGAIAAVIGVQWIFGWIVIDSRPVDALALALRDSIRSGIVEELVLRLVIFRLLWRAFGIWPALAGASVIFGALHLANPDSNLFAALCLIAGEGVGIGLYLLTGRIWASIGMHSAWNFTQGWIFGAAVSGTSEIAGGPLALRPAARVPELLSGGGFGPEASLAALVISLVASAIFLRWAWLRRGFEAPADDSAA